MFAAVSTWWGSGYFGTSRSTLMYKMSKNDETGYVYLDPLEGKPDSTFVFLHGLQQSAYTNYDKIVNKGMFPPQTRIILAQAPYGMVTTYGKTDWNRWFDIYIWATKNCPYCPSPLDKKEYLYNQDQIIEITDHFLKLLDQEIDLYDDKNSKRVFMGGFSQGCFTSTATLVRYNKPKPIGGIICLSGLQPLLDEHFENSSQALKVQSEIPFMQYHGDADPTVNINDAIYTHKYLKDVIYKNKKDNYTFQIEAGLRH